MYLTTVLGFLYITCLKTKLGLKIEFPSPKELKINLYLYSKDAE